MNIILFSWNCNCIELSLEPCRPVARACEGRHRPTLSFSPSSLVNMIFIYVLDFKFTGENDYIHTYLQYNAQTDIVYRLHW